MDLGPTEFSSTGLNFACIFTLGVKNVSHASEQKRSGGLAF
jgi:hypothetical protein